MSARPTPHQKLEELRRAGKPLDAIELALVLLTETPNLHNDAVFQRELGSCSLAAKMYPQAEIAFKRALDLKPKHTFAAWAGYAAVALEQGRFADAKLRYDEALMHHPEHPDLRLGRAKVAAGLGEHEDAQTRYEVISHDHPGSQEALIGFAKAAADLGHNHLAQERYGEGIRRFRNDAPLPFYIGHARCALDRGDYLQAETRYEIADRRAKGKSLAALRGLAETALLQGKFDGATACYQRGLLAFPKSIALRNGLAMTMLCAGNLDGAETLFEESVRDFKPNANAMSGYARVALQRKDYDAARTRYINAVQAFPDDMDTLLGAAQCEMLRHSGKDVKYLLTRAIQAAPKAPEPYTQLFAYALGEDDREARRADMRTALAGLYDCPPSLRSLRVLKLIVNNLASEAGLHQVEARRFRAALQFLEQEEIFTPQQLAPFKDPIQPEPHHFMGRLLGFSGTGRFYDGLYSQPVNAQASDVVLGRRPRTP